MNTLESQPMDAAADESEQLVARKLTVRRLLALPEAEARKAAAMLSEVLPIAARHELAFAGAHCWLTPLLAYRRRASDAHFADVWAKIGKLRSDDALDLAQYRDAPAKARRNNYQRVKMRDRRALDRLAVDVENSKRPATNKLEGLARRNYIKTVRAAWSKQRAKAIEEARRAAGGKLPKQREQVLVEKFWDDIEQDLLRRLPGR
jgi:hypothetical protein